MNIIKALFHWPSSAESQVSVICLSENNSLYGRDFEHA